MKPRQANGASQRRGVELQPDEIMDGTRGESEEERIGVTLILGNQSRSELRKPATDMIGVEDANGREGWWRRRRGERCDRQDGEMT